MYAVTLKCFHRHFKGDTSFHVETVHVLDDYIDEWAHRDDEDCKTIEVRKI